jgi:hypothetical protein
MESSPPLHEQLAVIGSLWSQKEQVSKDGDDNPIYQVGNQLVYVKGNQAYLLNKNDEGGYEQGADLGDPSQFGSQASSGGVTREASPPPPRQQPAPATRPPASQSSTTNQSRGDKSMARQSFEAWRKSPSGFKQEWTKQGMIGRTVAGLAVVSAVATGGLAVNKELAEEGVTNTASAAGDVAGVVVAGGAAAVKEVAPDCVDFGGGECDSTTEIGAPATTVAPSSAPSNPNTVSVGPATTQPNAAPAIPPTNGSAKASYEIQAGDGPNAVSNGCNDWDPSQVPQSYKDAEYVRIVGLNPSLADGVHTTDGTVGVDNNGNGVWEIVCR